MPLGPIFEAEATTSSRRARYFVLRSIYAVILLFVLWLQYGETVSRPWQTQAQPSVKEEAARAARFFASFAWVQIVAVLLLGPAIVAGTIAVERERRTIEYLFATDLANWEIVVGKLAVRLLHIGLVVLVGLPVLALAQLLGGIDPESLPLVVLLTLSTAAWVAALSLAISVWSPRARDAVVRAYFCEIGLLAIPPALWGMVTVLWQPALGLWTGTLELVLLQTHPFYPLAYLTFSQKFAAEEVWTVMAPALVSQGLVALACIAGACLAVRRVHLASRATGRRQVVRRRWRLWRPSLARSPMLWKELASEHAAIRLGIAARVAAGLIILWALGLTVWLWLESSRLWAPGRGEFLWFVAGMLPTISCAGLLILAARAASSITSEKERDTWISLLTSPLEARQIVYPKIAGALYSARWLVFLLSPMWVLAAIEAPTFLLVIPFFLGTLAAIGFFIAAMGVRLSLSSSNSTRAMAGTIAAGLFLGGGYLFCCAPLMWGPGSEETAIILAPCIPFLLAFPQIVFVDVFVEPGGMSKEMGVMLFAYCLGVAGYLIVGMGLAETTVGSFDRLAGRVDARSNRPPHARPPLRGLPAEKDGVGRPSAAGGESTCSDGPASS